MINWNTKIIKRVNATALIEILSHYLKVDKTRSASYLGFPGAQWLFERQMVEDIDHCKFHITGLEKNLSIYKKAILEASIQHHIYNLKYKDFYLDEKIKSFWDITYFDWMGTWSEEKSNDIHKLFQYQRIFANWGKKKNFYLMFTISLNHGRKESFHNIYKTMKSITGIKVFDNRTTKTVGIPYHIEVVAGTYGFKTKLLYQNLYPTFSHKNNSNFELSFMFKFNR